MAEIAYTVTATFPDEGLRDSYLAWLRDGHVAAVIEGGATRAWVVTVTEPESPITVETRYAFPSPDAFGVYLADHAPRLRSEGAARFGTTSGVAFRRTVGEVEAWPATNG